jgi:hypothetical protein
MEFKVVQKEIELLSKGWIPTFHDISKEVIKIVNLSGIKNGTCTVASHHTTCSVYDSGCSHDLDSFDLEFLQHDLLDIYAQIDTGFCRKQLTDTPDRYTPNSEECKTSRATSQA